jgi:hypothetical protein
VERFHHQHHETASRTEIVLDKIRALLRAHP